MKTETRAKHTPGPWASEPAMTCTGKTRMITHFGEIIAEVGAVSKNQLDKDIANARLIAVAPRMYNFILDAANNGNQDAKNILAAMEAEQ